MNISHYYATSALLIILVQLCDQEMHIRIVLFKAMEVKVIANEAIQDYGKY